MRAVYAPPFLRQLKKLPEGLQEEVFEKVELFQKKPKDPMLKTHKLKGRLAGNYSFSVNYQTRVVFQYISKEEAVLLAVGDHDVYKK
jgi:mRNA-degrading endonuclease YafQ of YafQ-DinJ toxin-antitoxin module